MSMSMAMHLRRRRNPVPLLPLERGIRLSFNAGPSAGARPSSEPPGSQAGYEASGCGSQCWSRSCLTRGLASDESEGEYCRLLKYGTNDPVSIMLLRHGFAPELVDEMKRYVKRMMRPELYSCRKLHRHGESS
jgi:hypothetical protein